MRARVPPSDVDDVVQVVALRATEHAGTLARVDRVRAWLFRLARHTVVDTLRDRERRQRLEAVAAGAELTVEAEAPRACDCSAQLARGLAPSYAGILSLVDLGGVPLPRAAARLGITVNNATVRLHRARKALRERLREHCHVESVRACQDCRCAEAGCCS